VADHLEQDVPAGVWQHWKHPEAPQRYLVLGLAHDTNVEDRDVVVYVPLYDNPALSGPRLAVRTVEDFLAWVDPSTGVLADEAEAGAGAVRRFAYLGPR
jgi:hypothetical protein